MSAELKDFRCKITPETDFALQAEAVAFDRDKADIVREILHAWAVKKTHEHKVWTNLARAEGVSGATEGTRGKAHR
jgi:hypothetical protein